MSNITTYDNFNSDFYNLCSENKKGVKFLFNQSEFKEEQNNIIFKSTSKKINLDINLKDYLEQNNKIFSFQNKSKEVFSNDENIIKISSFNNKYKIQIGNYVGKFNWNEHEIEIKSRFHEILLKRMLNFANDIFLDDVAALKGEANKSNFARFIIYYLFIQKLEKAFIMELPKSYVTINYHEPKLRGNIDINQLIKKDIPFTGRISSKSREQKENQEIIDILFKALNIIKTDGFQLSSVNHIYSYLKQKKKNNFVNEDTFFKARNSKALLNPIYSPYKEILDYASLIFKEMSALESKHGKIDTSGFVVNVAELYEVYVRKLLKHNFPNWEINSPEISLYKEQFYQRKIIPDIVMQKDDKLIVLDTKYKTMKFRGNKDGNFWDLDRNDFFQINTYMSFYNNSNYNVIAGGLIYPFQGDFHKTKCYSYKWFHNPKTAFIVDGIKIPSKQSENDFLKQLVLNENEFINRIKNIIQKH